ncbi:glycosyltransferase [bacterium]|nr:glycosyltransferase [bacterium]
MAPRAVRKGHNPTLRILFVNQYYSPDFAATAQQMSDLCERLVARGHEVHVLTSTAIYDGRDLKLPSYEQLNGVHVHRVGLEVSSRQRLRHRLLGYLSFFSKAFLQGTFLPRPDVTVVLTTPPLIGLLGSWLKLVRRTRFVYWVMDVYPDIALEAGVLSRIGITRAVWSVVGRFTYRNADRIVVLGSDMQQVIRRKLPRKDSNKVTVIRSWPGNDDVHPIPPKENTFRQQHLGDEAIFALMYSGNMGTCHAFQAVIPGIKSFAGRKDVHFSFVGGGKQLPKLSENLGEQKENVLFLPYQERESLSQSLSAPDAHLVTLQPRYDGLLVPSKIYGILAAGRAVLFAGSENNEVAHLIREAECGMVVPFDDAEAFRKAVEWMAANRAEVAEMGARGRRYFEERLQTDQLTSSFGELLELEAAPELAEFAPRNTPVRGTEFP